MTDAMDSREASHAAPPPPTRAAPCGCGVGGRETGGERRHATAVDPEIKRKVLSRLRRIEGQVRGVQRMVEDERYCADVMTQVLSVGEALRSVNRELLRNHLRHCVTTTLRSGDAAAAGAVYDEILALVERTSRP